MMTQRGFTPEGLRSGGSRGAVGVVAGHEGRAQAECSVHGGEPFCPPVHTLIADGDMAGAGHHKLGTG